MNLIKKFFGLASRENTGSRYLHFSPSKQAGMVVNHDTALTLSALWACTRVISEDVAKLPWNAFRRLPNGGRERISNSRVEYLLNQRPNNEMTAFSFRETLIAWALTWGNGYAEIQRDISGRPQALWPLAPDRVECKRDENGTLYYEVSNGTGPKSTVETRDMFHLHGLGFDGLTGYSVVSYAARSIGLGLAADQFGASFFGNNATLGGNLTHPGKLSDTAFDRLKDWINKRKGSQEAFKPAILEEGMKWEQAGIPPEDAQFIDSRKMTVNDMCRWFRVPPHKIGDLERATFSNIEEQSIAYVNDTLVSWITRLEQESQFKLIGPRAAVDYTKINIMGLLRGSSKARAEYYREMRNMGVYSVNEIRSYEDENPIGPEGDKRVMQMNMTTLEKIGEDEPPARTATPFVENEDQPNAKSVYVKMMQNTFRGIYIKQDRRVRGSSNIIPESDFVSWMGSYFNPEGDQVGWAGSLLVDNLTTVAKDIKSSDIVEDVVESYLPRHIQISRSRALDQYRGDTYTSPVDLAESEANHIIDDLVERHLIRKLEQSNAA